MQEEMIQFNRNVSPEASVLLIVGKLQEQRERIQAELDRIDAEIQAQLASVDPTAQHNNDALRELGLQPLDRAAQDAS